MEIVYWEEDAGWIGYLAAYPDYWTPGTTIEDLYLHLNDLCQTLAGGHLAGLHISWHQKR